MKLLLTCLLAMLLPTIALEAQAKKSYTFHGKVESVDAKNKSMSINGEKVEGWMDAMTMSYKIDNPDVFKTVKPGDTIEATVYDGDFTLYKVHVAQPQTKK